MMRSMNYRRSKALCIVLAFSCLLAEKMQARWEDTTFPLTSGQTWVNASTNTRYTVSGQAGNLTLTVSVADAGKNGGKGSVADSAFLTADNDYENRLSGVRSVVINEGITSIGNDAFRDYNDISVVKIASVSLPASLVTIGEMAFYGCRELTSVTIASGSQLETIGDDAFCKSHFSSIVLPCPKLCSIGNSAFDRVEGVQNLAEIVCLTEVPLTVDQFVFYSYRDQVTVYMLGSKKVNWEYAKAVKGLVTSVVKGTNITTFSADYSAATKKIIGGNTYYVEGSTVKLTLATSLQGSGVVFRANGEDLEKGSDGKYILTLPGDATTVTVSACIPQNISQAEVTLAEDQVTFDNSPKQPAVTRVKLGNTTLVAGTDYTVRYEDNVSPGLGKVIVTGRGNYCGSVTKTFLISYPIEGLTLNTSDGYYEIQGLSSFNGFLSYASSVSNTTRCENMKFRMMQDIDMTGQSFTPIENFIGTFDGNGKTITGLSGSNGLFKILGIGGVVTGLSLRDVAISGNYDFIGGIAGIGLGVIEDCHVTGSVSGQFAVGGIVGFEHLNDELSTTDPRIVHCSFRGTVTGNQKVGGIVGQTIRPVQYCTVSASTIISNSVAGGIVGEVYIGDRALYDFSHCTAAGVTLNGVKNIGPVCGNLGYADASTVHDNEVYYGVKCSDGIQASYVSGTRITIDGMEFYKPGAVVSISSVAGMDYVECIGATITDGKITMPESNVVVKVTWGLMFGAENGADGSAQHPYVVGSEESWNYFCDVLDNSSKGVFSGKTFVLDKDITVTRMAGSSYHDFTGTFDGQGHTLTVDYTTSLSYAAPFRYVEDCVIENLHVAGTINTSGQGAAGIAASQFGTVIIRGCRVSATINSTVAGDGTHGGLVAIKGNSDSSHLTIEGCVFDGKILSSGASATNKCGGFVGWRKDKGSLTIINSIFAPSELTVSTEECCTFSRNGGTFTGCYYTQAFGDKQGTAAIVSAGKPANIGAEGSTYSGSGITVFAGGLYWNGNYYCASEPTFEQSLTLIAATIAGESKYVTSFYNKTMNYQLPACALAYTVKGSGNNMVFYRIGEDSSVIPAGVGVVIVSEKASLELTPLQSVGEIVVVPGDLTGSDISVDNTSHDKYVLGIRENVLGFYKFSGDTIPAGKAYIE